MNKALTWQQLPVIVALVVAIAGGGVVWGQMDKQVQELERRQGTIDEQQERDSRLLAAIDERTEIMQKMQERILNELTRSRASFPTMR